MKNYILIVILLFVTLTSFSPFKTKWIKTKKENILLFTRPDKYTGCTSPNSKMINEYLDEGVACVKELNEKLGVNFDFEIKVFLYNYDEAKEQIGTNNGGGAIPKKRIVLYTYCENLNFDKERNRTRCMGIHEYVHIVSFNEIGISKTRLFTEGYATAIDGSYGGKKIEEHLEQSRMKTPSELLDSEDMFEGDFYPQAGFFIKWLFNEYSIEKSNKLFVMTKDKIKREFENITGEKFSIMEKNTQTIVINTLRKLINNKPLTYNMRPCWHADIQHFKYLAAFVPVDNLALLR